MNSMQLFPAVEGEGEEHNFALEPSSREPAVLGGNQLDRRQASLPTAPPRGWVGGV